MATPFDEPPTEMQARMDKKGFTFSGMRHGKSYSARHPTSGQLVWVTPQKKGKYQAVAEKNTDVLQSMRKEEAKYKVWKAAEKGKAFSADLSSRVLGAAKETDEASSANPLKPKRSMWTAPLSHDERVAKIMEARKRTGRDIPLPVDPRVVAPIGSVAPTTPKKKTGHTTFAHGTPTHTIPPPALSSVPVSESDTSDPSSVGGPPEIELGEATLERLAQIQEETYRNYREASSKSLAGSIAGTRAPARPDPDRDISTWRRARIGTVGYQQQRPSVTWKINEIARRNLSFRELLGWMPRYQAIYR